MKSKIIEIAYTCGFTTTQEITQALLKTSVETTKYEKHPFYNLIYIYIYIRGQSKKSESWAVHLLMC